MKLSLYRRSYVSIIPYAIIFNGRLINSANANSIHKHIANSLALKGTYGIAINSNAYSYLELIDHYEFDSINQLDQLLRDRNPELFL